MALAIKNRSTMKVRVFRETQALIVERFEEKDIPAKTRQEYNITKIK